MGKVGRGRLLAVHLPVVRDELCTALARGLVDLVAEVLLRAGEVHALRLRQSKGVRLQQRGAPDERRALQSGHAGNLTDHVRALGREEREEQAVRASARELRQDGAHVRLALFDGRDLGRSAQLAERVLERADQTFRVRIAVVDRAHAAQAELLIGETGHGAGLVQVVIREAVVAGALVGAGVACEVGRQGRRGVRWRDHDEAGLADDPRGCASGHRARCAHGSGDPRVARHGLGGKASAVRGALRVQPGSGRDCAAVDVAVVRDRHLEAPALGDAQACHARERRHGAYVYGLAGPHFDCAQRPGFELARVAGYDDDRQQDSEHRRRERGSKANQAR